MNGKDPVLVESIVSLMRREIPEEPSWIEPGILPKQGKMIFGGATKIGKSLILLELAQNLALGEPALGCPLFKIPKPTRVLLVEQEIGAVGLQSRANKAYSSTKDLGKLEENFLYSTKDRRLRLDTVEGHHRLRDLVGEYQPGVLMLDPIGKMHGWDENSNTQIGELFDVLDGLLNLGKGWDMSIIISHHFGKAPKDSRIDHDPLDFNNYRGAIRWSTDPDTLVTAHRVGPLPVDHEAWRLATRWRLRQGESPPDLFFGVNEARDLRVVYERGFGETTPKAVAAKLPPLKRLVL